MGRPPGADAESTRNEILEAALRAFADRGFDGASIRDITNEVGVGHNLVRHYFGSKEDLWRAAVHRGIGEPAEQIIKLLQVADAPAAETLRTALTLLTTELAVHPAAVRLLVSEALRGGERFDYIWEQFIAPAGATLEEFTSGPRTMPLAPVDPRVLGLYLLGAGISFFTLEALAAKVGVMAPIAGQPLDQDARQLIELVIAGATSHQSSGTPEASAAPASVPRPRQRPQGRG